MSESVETNWLNDSLSILDTIIGNVESGMDISEIVNIDDLIDCLKTGITIENMDNLSMLLSNFGAPISSGSTLMENSIAHTDQLSMSLVNQTLSGYVYHPGYVFNSFENASRLRDIRPSPLGGNAILETDSRGRLGRYTRGSLAEFLVNTKKYIDPRFVNFI